MNFRWHTFKLEEEEEEELGNIDLVFDSISYKFDHSIF